MSSPIVTFAVLSYNHAPYIIECISSILNQRFTDFEVIILDDASTDSTPQIVSSFADQRIRSIRHNKNIGLAQNINTAIDLALGEYLWLISADDALHDPDALNRALEGFHLPAVGIVWSSAVTLDSPSKTRLFSHLKNPPKAFPKPSLARFLAAENRICAPAAIARHSAFSRFEPSCNLKYCLDWLLWFQIGLRTAGHYQAEPLARYRIHGESMTRIHLKQELPDQLKEQVAFHTWMLGLKDLYPDISAEAAKALRADFVKLIAYWVFERTPSRRLTDYLGGALQLSQHVCGPTSSLRVSYSNCFRAAVMARLKTLLLNRNIRSACRTWRLLRHSFAVLDQ